MTDTINAFSTFLCVKPHFNMAKGVHLKFRCRSGTNRPITPTIRSYTHEVTRSSGAIADIRTQARSRSRRIRLSPTMAVPDRVITKEELAKHGSERDCWVAINGFVYDVSRFLPEHPGGPETVTEWAGAWGSIGSVRPANPSVWHLARFSATRPRSPRLGAAL